MSLSAAAVYVFVSDVTFVARHNRLTRLFRSFKVGKFSKFGFALTMT